MSLLRPTHNVTVLVSECVCAAESPCAFPLPLFPVHPPYLSVHCPHCQCTSGRAAPSKELICTAILYDCLATLECLQLTKSRHICLQLLASTARPSQASCTISYNDTPTLTRSYTLLCSICWLLPSPVTLCGHSYSSPSAPAAIAAAAFTAGVPLRLPAPGPPLMLTRPGPVSAPGRPSNASAFRLRSPSGSCTRRTLSRFTCAHTHTHAHTHRHTRIYLHVWACAHVCIH